MTTLTSLLRSLTLLVVVTTGALPALAQRTATQQGLERLEESLQPEVEGGRLSPRGIGPSIFVGATPAFEESRGWFPGAALVFVTRVFGRESIRVCEACMNPRVYVEDGHLEHNSVLTLQEIARIDAETRGDGVPARSAIWLDETPAGVSIRIVSIENGQVLFAGNYDGQLTEMARTTKNFNATLELGRRLRGEGLAHVFIDVAFYPGQHISMDFTEQFGPRNENLAGLTLSLLDPLFGVGAVYYRVLPFAWNLTLGAQVVLSTPSAVFTALTNENTELIDRIVTGVLVARLPLFNTNYAALLMVSTNGTVGAGISLMNFSLLPFLP